MGQDMARTVRDSCRVLLLVCGVCVAVLAKGGGAAGPRRPVASLNGHQQYLCSLLQNCTTWCSDCSGRIVSNLFHLLDSCDEWERTNPHTVGLYQYVFNCPPSSAYEACVSTHDVIPSRKCQFSNQSDLVCFSQENGIIHVLPGDSSDNPLSLMLLEDMCPSCSCSTQRPTTPGPPTMPKPTFHFVPPVDAKPTHSMTTAAGSTAGPDLGVIVPVAAVAGGVILLILLIIGCLCYHKKYRGKKKTNNREQEYDYIRPEEMTLRSQASMMTSQQLVASREMYPACGHRNFNNEMYGLNGVGNGTLPVQPPELPANHPPPSNPPPAAPYQELNRGQPRPADLRSAAVGGLCPRCRHLPAERSATAPHLDRPAGLDAFPTGAEGARNPYMALVKNNTCPTPGTPPVEPICKCHARPLSECSSVTGSVMSDPQGSRGQTTDHESDQRPLSGSSDMQESPYYFKMQSSGDTLPAPESPQYLKLEDAQTLPLDDTVGEVSPMLPNADSNGNNVCLKSISKDEGLTGTDSHGRLSHGSESDPSQSGGIEESNRATREGAVLPFDGQKQTPSKTASLEPEKSTPIGKSSKYGSAEGLPKDDYMHLIEGQARNDGVRGVPMESTV